MTTKSKFLKLVNLLLGVLTMPLGFHRRMGALFVRELVHDFFHSPASLRQKLWSYKRGFYSSSTRLYGLNNENYRKYLSDRDFLRMFPVNSRFRIWIDDKLTFKYILQPFNAFLPRYYGLLQKGRFQPLPEGKGLVSSDDLLSLLKTEGALALKPFNASSGDGFYKLAHSDGLFYLNNRQLDVAALPAFFNSLDSYLVCEYVQQHEALAAVFSPTVNSLRLLVINEGGDQPIRVYAYARFGTRHTGGVDNISAGGLMAFVDEATGSYQRGLGIVDSQLVHYDVHPDTGVPMRGTIPGWHAMLAKVFEMARYINQLEYLGFDIAITPDGFRVLEVNSFPQVFVLQSVSPLLKDSKASDYFLARAGKRRWF